jgi:hypothetical protein
LLLANPRNETDLPCKEAHRIDVKCS